MSRLEKYRAERRYKRRYASLFFLLLFIIIFGTCAVDYSTNWLVKNQKNVQIVRFTNQSPNIEIDFLNYTFKLDTSFINNDLDRLKQRLPNFIKWVVQ